MKLPWTTWTREQWWYFGVFGGLLTLWPGIAWAFGSPNVANIIYWVTALVVLAYTVETYGMRLEMVRQNEIAVQPLLIVTIKKVQAGIAPVPTFEDRVVLRNIGRGVALFVRVEDVQVVSTEDLRLVAKFETVDYLEPGHEEAGHARAYEGPEGEEHEHALGDFVAHLTPRYANRTYLVTIR